MKQEILEDVMKYLVPHFRFISFLILGHEHTELGLVQKRIREGKEKDFIEFYPEDPKLNIDLKRLDGEKGHEWRDVLEKQLDIIIETISKFEKKN